MFNHILSDIRVESIFNRNIVSLDFRTAKQAVLRMKNKNKNTKNKERHEKTKIRANLLTLISRQICVINHVE